MIRCVDKRPRALKTLVTERLVCLQEVVRGSFRGGGFGFLGCRVKLKANEKKL